MSDAAMSTPPIPHAMVEAAKEVLQDVLVTDDGGSLVFSFDAIVSAILSAALGVCEVREERRAVVKHDDGSTYTYPWAITDRQGSQRRLVLTTPAEPVGTEGAAT